MTALQTHDFPLHLHLAFNLAGNSMDKGRNSSRVYIGICRRPEEEMPCWYWNRTFAKQSALEEESKSWQPVKKMRQTTVTLKSHMQACGSACKSNRPPLNSDSSPCTSWTIGFGRTMSYSTSFPLVVCGCIRLYI